MTDKRRHRGPHPEDALLFHPGKHALLRRAVADLSWLQGRGYLQPSALKLVGDRFQLDQRQRIAVARAACSDAALCQRRRRQARPLQLVASHFDIDGYNLLTSIEAALAGGVLLRCRDGALRDMASMHGSYRKVQETVPALELIAASLAELGVAHAHWYLDSPVSNSGRLKAVMAALAAKRGWNWEIELVANPDMLLLASPQVVVTADSIILDGCRAWFNLALWVIERHVLGAVVVDLRRGEEALR